MMALSWYLCLSVAVLCGPPWPQGHSALAPENEVPLRPTAWLPDGKVTPIHLPKGQTRRLYFILKKKTTMMSVTVSPCDLPLEWTLVARTVKDKPPKSLHWSTKKSMPEVWWRGPGTEAKIHTYTGNVMDTYTGPSYVPASIYILRLRSKGQDTKATVYLHEGSGSSGAFPELPPDPRVHTLGVGMTSVTLSWDPSVSLTRLQRAKSNYDYCVLVNRKHNYHNFCAAREGIRKELEEDKKRKRKDKERKVTVWPILKDWWWQQWDVDAELRAPAVLRDELDDLRCVCKGTETVCTVSELVPDTRYYFDVFLIDGLNKTSSAYTGTFAKTHEEARPAIVPLREGELRWVTFRNGGSTSGEFFSFGPRGWPHSGLLTLQSCGGGEKIKVTISSKGVELKSQAVGEDLAQIWLQGSPTYLIHLEREETASRGIPAPGALKASVKMQASSAYHRQGAPSLPSTLQIKSFNRLRSCDSITLAWMGTEERSLYCVYRRRLVKGEKGGTPPCLGPESRSDTERVLCKYFQELNPRRAVTTAVIGDLEPGVTYVFDVYLMRRWGIPIKYSSKTVRTRKEC
ncbi:protein NDNF [Esox lucius]|uniref:Protein NDNF n=1 Tax=Esox lucius TaxID=8010 RepID=A0A3P8XMJ4_ESOLU|nr:protein NDNF [Esox lucius]